MPQIRRHWSGDFKLVRNASGAVGEWAAVLAQPSALPRLEQCLARISEAVNLQHSRKVDSEENQVVDDEDRRRINVQDGRLEGVRQVGRRISIACVFGVEIENW